MTSVPTAAPRGLCPDWILTSSNVHVAKDREWFDNYKPCKSFVLDIYVGRSTPVEGIGSVSLPVKRLPNKTGPNAHGILKLENVLHAPTMLCNIIGRFPLTDVASVAFGTSSQTSNGAIMGKDGRQLAYFQPGHPMFAVKLSGPPVGPAVGPSVLASDGAYALSVKWPDSERQRWESCKVQAGTSTTGTIKTTDAGNAWSQGSSDLTGASSRRSPIKECIPPYTAEEKAWLKQHHGNEFKLLQRYGLSIYKDEDRETGRQIVRTSLQLDGDEDEDGEGEDDIEKGLEGHMVDYLFTSDELDYIESGWANAHNFMVCYGLKFYKDEDCDEAKALVKALMSEHE